MGNVCFGGHSNPTEGSQPKNSSTGTLTTTTTTTSNDNSSSTTTTSTESSNLVSPSLLSVMLPPKQSGSKSLHCFTYNDLKNATRNFRHENFLGEGGFGAVYKGWIDEQGYTPTKSRTGMVIAVKKLHPDSMQGHKEWLTEVQFLGELHHSNLVRLVGFCAEDDYRLLAYEYMSRGSLESHLFRRGTSISWAIRMQVALGAAKGLAFLHDQKVIFRDFKTSNILLDSECNAKLSDFGLAKEGPSGDNTHVSTGVKGTYGYAAPEYVATGHLSWKSDIFSFGVVLLELLTGRRTIDKNLPFAERNLVDWAKPYLNDNKKIYRFIDPRLGGKYSSKGAQKIVAMASRCLQMGAKARPEMVEIVEMLESLVSSKETTKDA